MQPEITVERVPHNGHLRLSAIHDGRLVHRLYVGYAVREARRLFRELLRRS